MEPESRNKVLREALHRGYVGGTSGAMAMTIQVAIFLHYSVGE